MKVEIFMDHPSIFWLLVSAWDTIMAMQAQKKFKYGELFSRIVESFGTKIETLLQLGVISHWKASLEPIV
jgi:hypothetical protein